MAATSHLIAGEPVIDPRTRTVRWVCLWTTPLGCFAIVHQHPDDPALLNAPDAVAMIERLWPSWQPTVLAYDAAADPRWVLGQRDTEGGHVVWQPQVLTGVGVDFTRLA